MTSDIQFRSKLLYILINQPNNKCMLFLYRSIYVCSVFLTYLLSVTVILVCYFVTFIN